MRACSPIETLEREIAALHAQSFGWALSCCGRDRDLACDVLQEVYWKVFSGKAKFDGRSSLRTFLFGVIRLTALEQRRVLSLRWLRTSPRDATLAEPDEHAADAPTPSETVAEKQRAARLEAALEKLPPRQREVLHLTFYEGLSLAEAAAIMAVAVGTASQHYDRGKSRLHELLSADDGAPSR